MPFNNQYLARNSSSGNIDAGKQWVYNGTSTGSNETVSTIVASGYFNNAQATLAAYFPSGYTGTQGQLAVGDVIFVRGNDANGQYYVTSITTNVTLAVWQSTSGIIYSGSPANIGNLPAFGDTSGDLVDSGILATDVVVTNPGSDQSITAHSLLVTEGNLQAGSSGHAGTVASYPATGSKGHLALVGVANTGDTITTISNAAMGQASVISIPDPATSTADFVVAPAALVSGNLVEASGTAGLVADSGVSVASVTNLRTVTVTMDAAQVIAAYATPFQIVAAPGSGKAIMPIAAQIITEVSTAFTSGGDAQLQWDNTANAGGTVCLDATTPVGEITAATSQVYTQYGVPTTTATATASITGLGIFFTNATQAFATGTGSTVKVVLTYQIIPAV